LANRTTPGPHEPRLPPLARSELSPYARQIFDNVGPGGAANLVATLAHQPELFERFLPVTLALQAGLLSARQRESAILRLAYRRGCRYIWRQHVKAGLDAGMTHAEIASLVDEPKRGPWSATDGALLEAVDELVDRARIGDATWAALSAELSPAQLVELTVLIGHYSGLAFLANSTGAVAESGPPSDSRLDPWTRRGAAGE
jgi:4-carboxymuconolactone decarboxylase